MYLKEAISLHPKTWFSVSISADFPFGLPWCQKCQLSLREKLRRKRSKKSLQTSSITTNLVLKTLWRALSTYTIFSAPSSVSVSKVCRTPGYVKGQTQKNSPVPHKTGKHTHARALFTNGQARTVIFISMAAWKDSPLSSNTFLVRQWGSIKLRLWVRRKQRNIYQLAEDNKFFYKRQMAVLFKKRIEIVCINTCVPYLPNFMISLESISSFSETDQTFFLYINAVNL